MFAWDRFDGTDDRIQTRARSATGTLSAVQNLSDPGQNAGGAQVAVDADGDAVFTWVRADGSSSICCFRAQTRARSAAGALSAVENLSAAGQHASGAQVAVDADGDAVLTWLIQPVLLPGAGPDALRRGCPEPGADHHRRRAERVRAPGGRGRRRRRRVDLGAHGRNEYPRPGPRALGRRNPEPRADPFGRRARRGQPPQVAVAATGDGDAVFTWVLAGAANYRVQARTRSAAGVIGPVQTLSAARQDALEAGVAADADGDAVATWSRSDGVDTRVQAAAGP